MKTSWYILLLIGVIACEVKPRAINYGEDACHHCKMKLMDPHFGAEALTRKGKVYIFDDVNCLMNWKDQEKISEEELAEVLVTDYNQPETLIDATTAFYLKSPDFKTPMASGVAAFADYEALKAYKNKNGGIYLAWGELVTQFK